MSDFEYRVVWQREGRPKVRALYQTLQGAERCAKRQQTAAEEIDWAHDKIPPIIWGPVIEWRAVGPWVSVNPEVGMKC